MPKKICIIEDEKNIAEMYRVLFENEGYNVRCAYDGEEGLKLVEEFKPDLLLLDLMLPKVDGFEVLKTLQCRKITDRLMVCVLSNLDQRHDMERVYELGAKNYFVKSHITPRKLLDRLYRITAFAN
jgi:DNA-binding response OmpR family regulator